LILGMAGIGILSATYGRAARKLRVVSIVAVFLTIAAIAAGCGGGGPQILGTPTGTANFLVQATVQNAQGTPLNVTRSVALQLIVQ
jgi:hypothetical protein